MIELSVRTHFSAAHHLKGYPGSCASVHGHNWEVEVYVRGPKVNAIGILLDFRDLKAAVRDVLKEVDHHDLNALDAFRVENPTSEHLARFLFHRLSDRLGSDRCRVHRVCVCETPGSRACYWESDD